MLETGTENMSLEQKQRSKDMANSITALALNACPGEARLARLMRTSEALVQTL